MPLCFSFSFFAILRKVEHKIAIGEPRLTLANSTEQPKSEYKKSDRRADMFKTLNTGEVLDLSCDRVFADRWSAASRWSATGALYEVT
jgi:hypothetical protein